MSEAVKKMIGKEVTYLANEEIGLASIRYFELALSYKKKIDDNQSSFDQPKTANVVAPPTFIFETNQRKNGNCQTFKLFKSCA